MTRGLLRALHADPYGDLFQDRPLARLAKLFSPRYVVSKIGVLTYERRHPDHPWITQDAICLLKDHLQPSHQGFEWGSGRGSLWFARHSGSLVSVEHNPAWYATVEQLLAASGIRNVDYRLVEEPRYTEPIGDFPNACFDYILVDGLFRDRAMLASIPKLKPGGWLIFDNVNWYLPSESRTPASRSRRDGPATELFAAALDQVKAWKTLWTTNGVNDTAIFIKEG
jgi:predicted O-methyltransferase YrrM